MIEETKEQDARQRRLRASLALLRDLRCLLRRQAELGIAGYRRTAGLQAFLKPRSANAAAPAAFVPPPAASGGSGGALLAGGLRQLREEVAACRACPLAADRLGVVPGRGEGQALLMFVGDWSRQIEEEFAASVVLGPEEDAMVGRMVAALHLPPDRIHLTNLLKCCPRPGVEPDPACAAVCRRHLEREIALVRPVALCLLGALPAQTLLGSQVPLIRLRGRQHRYVAGQESLPVMPTFHPSLLLRQADLKTAAWQDLQQIGRWLQQAAGRQ